LIESHGGIAEDLASRRTRRRIQGVSIARWEEVAKHLPRVGIRDDAFPVQVIADERRDHDVKGATPVQTVQGRTEPSRQLLHTRLIKPGLDIAPVIIFSRHGTGLLSNPIRTEIPPERSHDYAGDRVGRAFEPDGEGLSGRKVQPT